MAEVRVADGVRIFYELSGSALAPVLVLNNGILMTTASWPMQVPAFAREYRVLTYDCRSQGQSDHPETPFTMATHATDLAALLDHLEVERAHVLGISYGGEVAQAFALEHADRVRSLVLADTVSEIDDELRGVVKEWRDVALAADPDRFFNATVGWNFSPGFIDAHPDLMVDARRRYCQLDFPAVVRLCEAFLVSVDFTDRLPDVTAPTCVIVGSADQLKGRRYAERIHRSIRRSTLHVIGGAGHATCWERPDEFNRIVLTFLGEH